MFVIIDSCIQWNVGIAFPTTIEKKGMGIMATMDILDLEGHLHIGMNEDNKNDLRIIVEELKRNHFPNVLAKSKQFREKYPNNKDLSRTLTMIEAICHAQMNEHHAASTIIQTLYQNTSEKSSQDLIILGELAFMSDYKLARRIMTEAVKQMEEEDEQDRIKLARGYLVLGEAEENLEKYIRAIKYFKKGLSYFTEEDQRDKHMMLFLHFKIGMLYSTLNEADEAIKYLEETLLLVNEDDRNIKINSLVSIAKAYGSKDDGEKALPYLEEALSLLDNSALKGTLLHADALTEMGFYYFDQSKLNEAIPFYDEAITIYQKLHQTSRRKLGMIYMQYAYCLEHKEPSDKAAAGRNYEHAIERLEKSNDRELLENALADVIAFFDSTGNNKKKREYENKFVKMVNA